MGAYPQGNRKARTLYLYKRCLIDWDTAMWGRRSWRHMPRTDRYKSRYRVRRRYKMEMLRTLREYDERLLNCFEDLWGRED